MTDFAKNRLLIPLAALLAVAPLIVHGASCGHDFDFHILNWLEAAQQLVHGHFPQWAYTPAYNAGEPRFVFYPPISWLLGAALGLAMPWAATPIVYTWLALTASGFTMHRLARAYAGPTAATLAATLYLANPYMLFTAYERTAYAELLAAAWIPLLLQAALAVEVSPIAIALPVALLWLTNAPAAVMGCYALALIALVRLVQCSASQRPGFTMKTAGGTALGLAMAGFYLLPAAYERRYVQVAMAMVPGMRIEDNTLFHRTGDGPHDDVLHTASILAVLLIGATAIALLRAGRTRVVTILSCLTAAIGCLLLPVANPIWRYAPELAFLQFPWRFLAILAAVLGLAAALALSAAQLKPWRLAVCSLGLAAGLIASAYYAFHQECDAPDTAAARVALFHSATGSDPTDEYTPQTADNDSLKHGDPPYWLVFPEQNDLQPEQSHPGPAPRHLALKLDAPKTLVLNRRDYPAWRVSRNGATVAAGIRRDDGLIAIPLPAGASTIDIAETRPLDRTAGDALSGMAALVAIAMMRRRNGTAVSVA